MKVIVHKGESEGHPDGHGLLLDTYGSVPSAKDADWVYNVTFKAWYGKEDR